jgi:hypothetical protein
VQWPNEVGVARPEDVPLYEALGDVTIDLGSSGIVSGGIYDCRASERLRGIGVTIEISPVLPETRYLYGFDSAARATGGGAMSGVFTATPVTPGFGTLIASYEGKEVGRAGPFPVRAGAITAVVLVPR